MAITSVSRVRFGLGGAEQLQAERGGAPGGGIQEQQLLQRHAGPAAAHRSGQAALAAAAGLPHRRLSQLLWPPAALGAAQNLSEPPAEPTDICGTGTHLES